MGISPSTSEVPNLVLTFGGKEYRVTVRFRNPQSITVFEMVLQALNGKIFNSVLDFVRFFGDTARMYFGQITR